MIFADTFCITLFTFLDTFINCSCLWIICIKSFGNFAYTSCLLIIKIDWTFFITSIIKNKFINFFICTIFDTSFSFDDFIRSNRNTIFVLSTMINITIIEIIKIITYFITKCAIKCIFVRTSSTFMICDSPFLSTEFTGFITLFIFIISNII